MLIVKLVPFWFGIAAWCDCNGLTNIVQFITPLLATAWSCSMQAEPSRDHGWNTYLTFSDCFCDRFFLNIPNICFEHRCTILCNDVFEHSLTCFWRLFWPVWFLYAETVWHIYEKLDLVIMLFNIPTHCEPYLKLQILAIAAQFPETCLAHATTVWGSHLVCQRSFEAELYADVADLHIPCRIMNLSATSWKCSEIDHVENVLQIVSYILMFPYYSTGAKLFWYSNETLFCCLQTCVQNIAAHMSKLCGATMQADARTILLETSHGHHLYVACVWRFAETILSCGALMLRLGIWD